jgi:hypothetical protein
MIDFGRILPIVEERREEGGERVLKEGHGAVIWLLRGQGSPPNTRLPGIGGDLCLTGPFLRPEDWDVVGGGDAGRRRSSRSA